MSTLHIVGGGLAGMTVAWQVTRPDADGHTPFEKVVLYERSGRLGGTAGSNEVPAKNDRGNAWSDHGYHLFPRWYRNVIELMGEIGVDYDDVIVDGERFSQAARLPKVRTEPKRDAAPGAEIEYGPARQLFWVAITTADLISMPDEKLRELTMADFLKQRFPMLKDKVQPVYEGLLLKALAAKIEDMSALAVAKLFRRWSSPLTSLKDPSWSSLSGSLQQQFIIPFEQALCAAGVKRNKGAAVEVVRFDDAKAVKLEIHGRDPVEVKEGDQVVLAVPPKQLAALLADASDELAVTEPLAKLEKMSAQFAGLDIYFAKEQLTPREHFGFEKSNTTAYNITPVWRPDELVDERAPTVVQLVVPRPMTDRRDEIEGKARKELAYAFDFSAGDEWVTNVNADSPLSLANKGVYEAREKLERGLRDSNVWISGDFMASSIGVPSMEGAVGNGRRVAAELRGLDSRSVDEDVVVPATIKALARFVRGVILPIQALWKLRTQ